MEVGKIPTGPKGEKRPADVIGNALNVMRVAAGEETDEAPDDGKDPRVNGDTCIFASIDPRIWRKMQVTLQSPSGERTSGLTQMKRPPTIRDRRTGCHPGRCC
jgi:hypothetical protein